MKLPSNQTHIKVPISAIRDTGNVRLEYDEEGIRELAASIRRDGLINAVTVKPPVEDENGIKTYELIAGHRRIRALKYLCEQGDDFSMVECKILTGEMWALQMIENIQRTDLSSRDKEEAISYALSIGLSQTQIAEKLSKPIQYISDIVAGAKIRKIADEHGLDTKDIATKTLSQLRSIPEEEVPVFVEQLIREGGTYRVATRMMNAQKQWEDAHSQSNPTTYVSSEKSEQDDIDEQINGMFMDEADDVEYDENESMIEPAEMTEAEFEKESSPADEALETTTHVSSKPKKDKETASFNWYLRPNDRNAMMSVLGRLPFYIKQMPLNTKICVQTGSKLAEISSVIYESEENRLIFRCLEDFGV